MGLGGPQSHSGHGSEGKNFQPLRGLEPPITHPLPQRYTTELSRLHFIYLAVTFKVLDEHVHPFSTELEIQNRRIK
jgi:hypothetical protein